jgi:histidine ammonia-lyase
VHLLACAQAVELRGETNVSAPIRTLQARVRALAEPVTDDRPMDADIVAVLEGVVRSDAPWTLDCSQKS